MRWLLLTGLGLLAVLGVVFYQRKKSATAFETYAGGLEAPPPPPPPDWNGSTHPTWSSPAGTSDIVLIYPDGYGHVGQGEQLTAENMVSRYGIDKAKGIIGFAARNRPSPLALPILMTPKEVNQISTAWGGSIGYFETLKFANDVGAKLLALFPPTRGVAVGYTALSNRLAPPPPPPISG